MKSKSNAMLELNGVENAIYRYDTFNFKQVVKTWKQKPQIFIVNVKLYMHRIQSTTTFLKYIQFKCVNLYLYQ